MIGKRFLPGGILIGALAVGSAALGAEPDLQVNQRSRSLQPGEVVLLTITADQPLKSLRASVFGKTFPFFPETENGPWKGLVGIDLGVKAGSYTLILEGETESGPVRIEKPLKVVSKKFPTRRLTVDEKYVTPPAEVLERIREESAKISALFAQSTPARLWRGAFQLPVPNAANSGFGKRSILNGKLRSPHGGTDFDSPEGTPVKAPNSGVVVLAQELYYSGNTVIVDHGMGLYSYFAHLSRIDREVGDRIRQGDVLGLVGATGRVTGPHLHWTVKLVETRVDPLSLIAALSEEG